MFSSLTLGLVWKWALSKLTLRNIVMFLGACVIAFGMFKFHNWSFDRGAVAQHKIDQKTIDKVTGERDLVTTQFDAYRGAFKTWVARSASAREQMAIENDKTVTKLEADLQTAKQQAAKTRGRTHDIPQYIPPASDFILPVGFVWLYNLSLEGEPGYSTSPNGLSQSLSLNAGDPSGIAISTLADVSTKNNAECVYRGQVIQAWQTWYVDTKSQFDKAQADAAAKIPRLEAD